MLYVREACYVVGVHFFPLVSHICRPPCLITASVAPQPVAPVKPPVVAEWGSGVTPRLDPDTISKHVKQMVDVSMWLCSKPVFHFRITCLAKAELTKCSFTSGTERLIALLPPAVHYEKLRPEPGWLHFIGGLWKDRSQLPLLFLHSRNWQVRKLQHKENTNQDE